MGPNHLLFVLTSLVGKVRNRYSVVISATVSLISERAVLVVCITT